MTTKRIRVATRLFVLVAVCGMFAGKANAAPILSVDFNNASPTQAGGFDGQTALTDTYATSEGDLTVTFASGGTFDRGLAKINAKDGGASFTYNDLYRDFYFLNGGVGTTATLTLSNSAIQANTDYDVRFWAYDTDTDTGVNRVATFAGVSGTSGGGNLAYTQGATLNDNFQFSDVYTFTSDGTGAITIDITSTGAGVNAGAIRLPGLEISTIEPPATAPEPSSALLAILAIVGLAFRRHRRRNS